MKRYEIKDSEFVGMVQVVDNNGGEIDSTMCHTAQISLKSTGWSGVLNTG